MTLHLVPQGQSLPRGVAYVALASPPGPWVDSQGRACCVVRTDAPVDGFETVPDEMLPSLGTLAEIEACNDWVVSDGDPATEDVVKRAEKAVDEMLDLANNHTAITSRILKAKSAPEQVQGLLSADGALVEVRPVGEWRAE